MRASAVLNPIKLILTNYPEGKTETLTAQNNPEKPEDGEHDITFSRELYIERDDFMEDAPKKFFRLKPEGEVRLKNAYIIKCTGCKKDEAGNVIEVYAEYDPESRSGMPGSNRKVKGTIHWVNVADAVDAEVRLYDRLFNVENLQEEKDRDFHDMLNPDSLTVITNAKVEPWLKNSQPLQHFQFQRIGYFNVDPDTTENHLVFNRTVALKDSWAKEQKKA